MFIGISGKTELYRNGELNLEILNDAEYDYETPIIHEFDPPFVLLPTDEIKTICHFNTLDGTRARENTVHYGDGTQVWILDTWVHVS